MPVKATINKNWSKEQVVALDKGVFEIATDIHKRAGIIAPVQDGNLVNSGKIEPVEDGYKVKFGSAKVPYARRRHEENKKNPQTKQYLKKAGDSIKQSDTSKYFRNKGL